MKRLGTAMTAAWLLWYTAAGTAGEAIPAPHDFAAGSTPAAGSHDFAAGSAPVVVGPQGAMPAGPGCAACATCGGGCGCGHQNNFRAWLGYHPLERLGCDKCSCCSEGRWVPLYLYFLGRCQEHPCTACGGGCGCWSGNVWSGTPTGVGFVSH